VGDIFTFEKYKSVLKRGKVSKVTKSVDFIDQSVDTFLTFLLKMDTNLCPRQERPTRAREKVFEK